MVDVKFFMMLSDDFNKSKKIQYLYIYFLLIYCRK